MSVAALVTCVGLAKSYGVRPLFDGVSLVVAGGERVGLIGPNGAGKSTLLKILAGLERPDRGDVDRARGARVAYLAQDESFAAGATVESVFLNALHGERLEEHEAAQRVRVHMSRLGFADPAKPVETLSGGWRKRLALGCQLVLEPDLLLLDEPTNHLDLEAIVWLEEFLAESPMTFVVVSHDRYLLERATTRVVELDPRYPDGYFSVSGCYSDFLERRQEQRETEAQAERSLANLVRREVEWLRKGPRARRTKAVYRVRDARGMVDDLAQLRERLGRETSPDLDFTATGRRTKDLIVAKGLGASRGGRTLFRKVDVSLGPGARLGVVGVNGTGKTTLLRMLAADVPPDEGAVRHADNLVCAYFDQGREHLDKSETLRRALAPNGDTFVVRGVQWHVVGWAKRFLFQADQLERAVGTFSGGEQARVLVARLMRGSADVLLLDEPTNDLDIPSIEVLEESLLSFPGAVVLITHDRHMLDRVCTSVVGLHGEGASGLYADVSQWQQVEEDLREQRRTRRTSASKVDREAPAFGREERRELSNLERAIAKAEEALSALRTEVQDPALATRHEALGELWQKIEVASAALDGLYERWQALEERREADEAARRPRGES